MGELNLSTTLQVAQTTKTTSSTWQNQADTSSLPKDIASISGSDIQLTDAFLIYKLKAALQDPNFLGLNAQTCTLCATFLESGVKYISEKDYTRLADALSAATHPQITSQIGLSHTQITQLQNTIQTLRFPPSSQTASVQATQKLLSYIQWAPVSMISQENKTLMQFYFSKNVLDVSVAAELNKTIPSEDKFKIIQTLAKTLDPAASHNIPFTLEDTALIRNAIHHFQQPAMTLEEMADTLPTLYPDAYPATQEEADFRSKMYLIDPDAPQVTMIIQTLLNEGVISKDMSNEDMAEAILTYVQNNYDYKAEASENGQYAQDNWQSIQETIQLGQGDCEDLAILTSSLLMNALQLKGYSKDDTRDMVHLSAGYITDEAGNKLGHALTTLTTDGQTLALDATSLNGPLNFDTLQYEELFRMNDTSFEKFGVIDSHFTTAANTGKLDVDGLLDRIDTEIDNLNQLLGTKIEIPSFDKDNIYRHSAIYDIVKLGVENGTSLNAIYDSYIATHAYNTSDGSFSKIGNQSDVKKLVKELYEYLTVGFLEEGRTGSKIKADLDQYFMVIVENNKKNSNFSKDNPLTKHVDETTGKYVYDSYSNFGFFKLDHTTIENERGNVGKINMDLLADYFKTPPDKTIHITQTEIISDGFANYVNGIRESINLITTAFQVINVFYDQTLQASREIADSADDEYTKYQRNQVRKEADKARAKFSQAINKFQQKLNDAITQLSDQLFNYVAVQNKAQYTAADLEITTYGRASIPESIGSELTNEYTGAFDLIRAQLQHSLNNQRTELTLKNTEGFFDFSRQMTDYVSFFSDDTKEEDLVKPGSGTYQIDKLSWELFNGPIGDGLTKNELLQFFDYSTQELRSIKTGVDGRFDTLSNKSDNFNNFDSKRLESAENSANSGDLKLARFFNRAGNENLSEKGMYIDTNYTKLLQVQNYMTLWKNQIQTLYTLKMEALKKGLDVAQDFSGYQSESLQRLYNASQQALDAEITKLDGAFGRYTSALTELGDSLNKLINARKELYVATKGVTIKASKLAAQTAAWTYAAITAPFASLGYATLGAANCSANITLAGTFAAELPLCIAYTATNITNYYLDVFSDLGTQVVDATYLTADIAVEENLDDWMEVKTLYSDTVYNSDRITNSAVLHEKESSTNFNSAFNNVFSDANINFISNYAASIVERNRELVASGHTSKYEVAGPTSPAWGVESNKEYNDVSNFLMDRHDGYLAKDSIKIAAAQHTIAIQNQVLTMMLTILKMQYEAIESVMQETFGSGKQGAYKRFDSQIGNILGLEDTIRNYYLQEVDQVQNAIQYTASKERKLSGLYYDALFDTPSRLALATFSSVVPLVPNEPDVYWHIATHTLNSGTGTLLPNTIVQTISDDPTVSRPWEAPALADLERLKAYYSHYQQSYSTSWADYHTVDIQDDNNSKYNAKYLDKKSLTKTFKKDASVTWADDDIHTFQSEGLRDTIQDQRDIMFKLLSADGSKSRYGTFDEFSTVGLSSDTLDLGGGYNITGYKEVKFQDIIDTRLDLNQAFMARVILMMIEQIMYNEKQTIFKNMFGNSSAAQIVDQASAVVDQINNMELGLVDNIVSEMQTRVQSFNQSFEQHEGYFIDLAAAVSAQAVQSLIPVVGNKITQATLKAVRKSFNAQVFSASTKITLGSLGLQNQDTSLPDVNSAFLDYDTNVSEESADNDDQEEAEAKEKSEKENKEDNSSDGKGYGITGSNNFEAGSGVTQTTSGGRARLNAGEKTKASVQLQRRQRQFNMLQQVNTQINQELADVGSEFSGDSGSSIQGKFSKLTNLLGRAEKANLDSFFAAIQSKVDAHNRSVDRLTSGAAQLGSSVISGAYNTLSARGNAERKEEYKASGKSKPTSKKERMLKRINELGPILAQLIADGAVAAALGGGDPTTDRYNRVSKVDGNEARFNEVSNEGAGEESEGGVGVASTAALENAALNFSLQAENNQIRAQEIRDDTEKTGSIIANQLSKLIKDRVKAQFREVAQRKSKKNIEQTTGKKINDALDQTKSIANNIASLKGITDPKEKRAKQAEINGSLTNLQQDLSKATADTLSSTRQTITNMLSSSSIANHIRDNHDHNARQTPDDLGKYVNKRASLSKTVAKQNQGNKDLLVSIFETVAKNVSTNAQAEGPDSKRYVDETRQVLEDLFEDNADKAEVAQAFDTINNSKASEKDKTEAAKKLKEYINTAGAKQVEAAIIALVNIDEVEDTRSSTKTLKDQLTAFQNVLEYQTDKRNARAVDISDKELSEKKEKLEEVTAILNYLIDQDIDEEDDEIPSIPVVSAPIDDSDSDDEKEEDEKSRGSDSDDEKSAKLTPSPPVLAASKANAPLPPTAPFAPSLARIDEEDEDDEDEKKPAVPLAPTRQRPIIAPAPKFKQSVQTEESTTVERPNFSNLGGASAQKQQVSFNEETTLDLPRLPDPVSISASPSVSVSEEIIIDSPRLPEPSIASLSTSVSVSEETTPTPTPRDIKKAAKTFKPKAIPLHEKTTVSTANKDKQRRDISKQKQKDEKEREKRLGIGKKLNRREIKELDKKIRQGNQSPRGSRPSSPVSSPVQESKVKADLADTKSILDEFGILDDASIDSAAPLQLDTIVNTDESHEEKKAEKPSTLPPLIQSRGTSDSTNSTRPAQPTITSSALPANPVETRSRQPLSTPFSLQQKQSVEHSKEDIVERPILAPVHFEQKPVHVTFEESEEENSDDEKGSFTPVVIDRAFKPSTPAVEKSTSSQEKTETRAGFKSDAFSAQKHVTFEIEETKAAPDNHPIPNTGGASANTSAESKPALLQKQTSIHPSAAGNTIRPEDRTSLAHAAEEKKPEPETDLSGIGDEVNVPATDIEPEYYDRNDDGVFDSLETDNNAQQNAPIQKTDQNVATSRFKDTKAPGYNLLKKVGAALKGITDIDERNLIKAAYKLVELENKAALAFSNTAKQALKKGKSTLEYLENKLNENNKPTDKSNVTVLKVKQEQKEDDAKAELEIDNDTKNQDYANHFPIFYTAQGVQQALLVPNEQRSEFEGNQDRVFEALAPKFPNLKKEDISFNDASEAAQEGKAYHKLFSQQRYVARLFSTNEEGEFKGPNKQAEKSTVLGRAQSTRRKATTDRLEDDFKEAVGENNETKAKSVVEDITRLQNGTTDYKDRSHFFKALDALRLSSQKNSLSHKVLENTLASEDAVDKEIGNTVTRNLVEKPNRVDNHFDGVLENRNMLHQAVAITGGAIYAAGGAITDTVSKRVPSLASSSSSNTPPDKANRFQRGQAVIGKYVHKFTGLSARGHEEAIELYDKNISGKKLRDEFLKHKEAIYSGNFVDSAENDRIVSSKAGPRLGIELAKAAKSDGNNLTNADSRLAVLSSAQEVGRSIAATLDRGNDSSANTLDLLTKLDQASGGHADKFLQAVLKNLTVRDRESEGKNYTQTAYKKLLAAAAHDPKALEIIAKARNNLSTEGDIFPEKSSNFHILSPGLEKRKFQGNASNKAVIDQIGNVEEEDRLLANEYANSGSRGIVENTFFSLPEDQQRAKIEKLKNGTSVQKKALANIVAAGQKLGKTIPGLTPDELRERSPSRDVNTTVDRLTQAAERIEDIHAPKDTRLEDKSIQDLAKQVLSNKGLISDTTVDPEQITKQFVQNITTALFAGGEQQNDAVRVLEALGNTPGGESLYNLVAFQMKSIQQDTELTEEENAVAAKLDEINQTRHSDNLTHLINAIENTDEPRPGDNLLYEEVKEQFIKEDQNAKAIQELKEIIESEESDTYLAEALNQTPELQKNLTRAIVQGLVQGDPNAHALLRVLNERIRTQIPVNESQPNTLIQKLYEAAEDQIKAYSRDVLLPERARAVQETVRTGLGIKQSEDDRISDMQKYQAGVLISTQVPAHLMTSRVLDVMNNPSQNIRKIETINGIRSLIHDKPEAAVSLMTDIARVSPNTAATLYKEVAADLLDVGPGQALNVHAFLSKLSLPDATTDELTKLHEDYTALKEEFYGLFPHLKDVTDDTINQIRQNVMALLAEDIPQQHQTQLMDAFAKKLIDSMKDPNTGKLSKAAQNEVISEFLLNAEGGIPPEKLEPLDWTLKELDSEEKEEFLQTLLEHPMVKANLIAGKDPEFATLLTNVLEANLLEKKDAIAKKLLQSLLGLTAHTAAPLGKSLAHNVALYQTSVERLAKLPKELDTTQQDLDNVTTELAKTDLPEDHKQKLLLKQKRLTNTLVKLNEQQNKADANRLDSAQRIQAAYVDKTTPRKVKEALEKELFSKESSKGLLPSLRQDALARTDITALRDSLPSSVISNLETARTSNNPSEVKQAQRELTRFYKDPKTSTEAKKELKELLLEENKHNKDIFEKDKAFLYELIGSRIYDTNTPLLSAELLTHIDTLAKDASTPDQIKTAKLAIKEFYESTRTSELGKAHLESALLGNPKALIIAATPSVIGTESTHISGDFTRPFTSNQAVFSALQQPANETTAQDFFNTLQPTNISVLPHLTPFIEKMTTFATQLDTSQADALRNRIPELKTAVNNSALSVQDKQSALNQLHTLDKTLKQEEVNMYGAVLTTAKHLRKNAMKTQTNQSNYLKQINTLRQHFSLMEPKLRELGVSDEDIKKLTQGYTDSPKHEQLIDLTQSMNSLSAKLAENGQGLAARIVYAATKETTIALLYQFATNPELELTPTYSKNLTSILQSASNAFDKNQRDLAFLKELKGTGNVPALLNLFQSLASDNNTKTGLNPAETYIRNTGIFENNTPEEIQELIPLFSDLSGGPGELLNYVDNPITFLETVAETGTDGQWATMLATHNDFSNLLSDLITNDSILVNETDMTVLFNTLNNPEDKDIIDQIGAYSRPMMEAVLNNHEATNLSTRQLSRLNPDTLDRPSVTSAFKHNIHNASKLDSEKPVVQGFLKRVLTEPTHIGNVLPLIVGDPDVVVQLKQVIKAETTPLLRKNGTSEVPDTVKNLIDYLAQEDTNSAVIASVVSQMPELNVFIQNMNPSNIHNAKLKLHHEKLQDIAGGSSFLSTTTTANDRTNFGHAMPTISVTPGSISERTEYSMNTIEETAPDTDSMTSEYNSTDSFMRASDSSVISDITMPDTGYGFNPKNVTLLANVVREMARENTMNKFLPRVTSDPLFPQALAKLQESGTPEDRTILLKALNAMGTQPALLTNTLMTLTTPPPVTLSPEENALPESERRAIEADQANHNAFMHFDSLLDILKDPSFLPGPGRGIVLTNIVSKLAATPQGLTSMIDEVRTDETLKLENKKRPNDAQKRLPKDLKLAMTYQILSLPTDQTPPGLEGLDRKLDAMKDDHNLKLTQFHNNPVESDLTMIFDRPISFPTLSMSSDGTTPSTSLSSGLSSSSSSSSSASPTEFSPPHSSEESDDPGVLDGMAPNPPLAEFLDTKIEALHRPNVPLNPVLELSDDSSTVPFLSTEDSSVSASDIPAPPISVTHTSGNAPAAPTLTPHSSAGIPIHPTRITSDASSVPSAPSLVDSTSSDRLAPAPPTLAPHSREQERFNERLRKFAATDRPLFDKLMKNQHVNTYVRHNNILATTSMPLPDGIEITRQPHTVTTVLTNGLTELKKADSVDNPKVLALGETIKKDPEELMSMLADLNRTANDSPEEFRNALKTLSDPKLVDVFNTLTDESNIPGHLKTDYDDAITTFQRNASNAIQQRLTTVSSGLHTDTPNFGNLRQDIRQLALSLKTFTSFITDNSTLPTPSAGTQSVGQEFTTALKTFTEETKAFLKDAPITEDNIQDYLQLLGEPAKELEKDEYGTIIQEKTKATEGLRDIFNEKESHSIEQQMYITAGLMKEEQSLAATTSNRTPDKHVVPTEKGVAYATKVLKTDAPRSKKVEQLTFLVSQSPGRNTNTILKKIQVHSRYHNDSTSYMKLMNKLAKKPEYIAHDQFETLYRYVAFRNNPKDNNNDISRKVLTAYYKEQSNTPAYFAPVKLTYRAIARGMDYLPSTQDIRHNTKVTAQKTRNFFSS